MTDFRNLFSPLFRRRSLLALVAGLALAFGMVAPHDLAVERSGLAARVAVAESAIHPGAPAHFEAAEIEVHPACAACLVQLGGRSVLDRPLILLPALPPCGAVAMPAAQVSAAKPPFLGPARAPPAASLFA